MLNTTVVDMERLCRAALSFGVPNELRLDVWRLRLGVLPVYRDAWPWEQQQRKQQYYGHSHLPSLITLHCSPSTHLVVVQCMYGG
jgi:hypothetical protein